MIAFRNNDFSQDDGGFSFQHSQGSDNPSIQDLKKLFKQISKEGTIFGEGAYHSNLSPQQVEKIISFLMYAKGTSSLDITITLEDDGYHLGLLINKVEK